MNEPTDVGDTGVWDRVFNGRASSRRRAIGNAALAAARCATLVAEGARLIDHLPDTNRSLEIHGIAGELDELSDSIKAIADYLRGEAGQPSTGRMSFWYTLRRTFVRWFRE